MQQQPGQNMAQTPVQVPILSKQQQQQTQGGHSTFLHLNHQKTYNVVSLLKNTSTQHQLSNQQQKQPQPVQHHHSNQQQQQQGLPHAQTFSNILNRSHTPSGPTTSAANHSQPILCQISTQESGATNNVYAINPRIVGNISIDANGTPNNSGNSGIMSINVGCIDNRKYDYQKNKLLNNNLQAAQEYNPSGSSLGAGSNNVRANQQTANMYRGPTPTTVPRNNAGSRHMMNISAMYSQALPQNMIVQNFQTFPQRQPTAFPAHQFAFQQTIPQHFYPVQYYPVQPQAPTHRGAVGVTSNASVGNPMTGGPLSGPPGQSQAQVPMAAGTVITSAVAAPGPVLSSTAPSAAAQVSVGVPSMVIPPPVTQQLPVSHKRRSHALPIIDPSTNKNILEDLPNQKRSSNSETEYQETASAPLPIQPDTNLTYSISGQQQQQKPEFSNISSVGSVIMMTPADTASRANLSQHASNTDMHHVPQHREIGQIGQTPVVSAMSNAPSIEIPPSQPKSRSKKIPIVAPKEDGEVHKDHERRQAELEASSDEPELTTAQQKPEKQIVDSCSNATVATDSSSIATNLATEQEKENSENLASKQTKNEICLETENKKAIDMQTGVASITEPTMNAVAAMPALTNTDEETASKTIKQYENSTIQKEESANRTKSTPESVSTDIGVLSSISNGCNADVQNGSVDIPASVTCDETDRATISNEQGVHVEAPRREVLEKTKDEKNITAQSESSTDPIADERGNESSSMETEINQPLTHAESLIQYNEGQWSPQNPSGKKQYDRDQLLQLREAKASRVQPEVSNSAILPQCNLMPTFARNSGQSKRMHSMAGMGSGGGHRGGDGGGSGSGNYGSKQSSMSGVNARGSTKGGIIHVNLSLNQDVKLNETDNAWRPRVLLKGEEQEDAEIRAEREKEDLLRRVRGILNKLTPEKFDALIEEIIKLKIDTREKMEAVMILVFEKAVDEPNFSVSYARLCHRLIVEVKTRDEGMEEGTKSNLSSFRNALLDKTEREFTMNVTQNNAKQTKLQPIIEKIKTCSDPVEKAELEAQLEEEELKVRRRSTGTVRFIGELFKISMLTVKIIYSCIEQLLNPNNEDMLECLCKLLTTVGAKLEQASINNKEPNKTYSLDKVIARMQAIASKTGKESNRVSSRVRFMLQDVIDLRKNKWQSKRNEAPKTMGQIEKETKSEQMSSQFLPYSGSLSTGPVSGSGGGNMGGGGGNKRGGDDRGRYNDHRSGYSGSHSQRGGDSGRRPNMGTHNSGNSAGNANGSGSGNDDAWHVQTGRNRSLLVDSNKLEGLMNFNQDMGSKKMGGMAQFVWPNSKTQQTTASSQTASAAPQSNFFAALSLDDRSNVSDRDRDRERDRDRSGPRNKGSYNKNSIEQDRRDYWSDRNRMSRTGSSQVSRENSSSRGGPQSGGVRSMNTAAVPKSASHSNSKYTQPPVMPAPLSAPRLAGKSSATTFDAIKRTASSDIPSSPSSTSPTPAVFEESTEADVKIIKSVIDEIIETLASDLSAKSVTEAASCMGRIGSSQKCGFLYYILTDYLHTRYVGPTNRRILGVVVRHLIETNILSVQHFTIAYEQFADIAYDLMVDIPELWTYIFQFTGPLISSQLITVYDLWTERLRNDKSSSNLGERFLKAFLNCCTREIGPTFTRNMWTKDQIKWTQFMPETTVHNFIKSNKYEYVENESAKPFIEVRNENKEGHIKQVVDHIKHLLQEGANADSIIDYINGNIVDIDKQFIRSLTTTLCVFAIDYQDASYKLDLNKFQKICVPVLQRFIEVVEERELECLYAMQLLVHSREHPRGLLCELFAQLYDVYLISHESFVKWRDSNDQSAGKGVAVKGLNSFFNQLQEETSDENN